MSITGYQARRILDVYSDIPKTRKDQINLIRICYNSLHGKPIHQCKDSQVGAVATKFYYNALKKMGKDLPFEENKELIEQARYDEFRQLNLIFAEDGVYGLEERLWD